MDINTMAGEAYEHARRSGFHDGHPLDDWSADWDADRLLDYARSYITVKLALITTEVSEAIDEVRSNPGPLVKYYREDGKPEGLESELADVILRTGDLAASFGIDLEAAVIEKHEYNLTRPAKHGKNF